MHGRVRVRSCPRSGSPGPRSDLHVYELSAVACCRSSSVSARAGAACELLEDLAGLLEDGAGFARSAEAGEAAALAEQGERLLGNDTERLPALGGIGVPGGRGLEVAVGFGEGGACRRQGVLLIVAYAARLR